MALISLVKKYFCCYSKNNTQVDIVPIESITNKQLSAQFDLLSNSIQSSQHTENYIQILHPLTANEAFELYNADEDCQCLNLSPYYRIEHLPSSDIEKPTLVLDLDNTLIYSTTKEMAVFDHKIVINHHGKSQTVWIVERPGLQQFLDDVSQKYDLVLFTAGIQQYGVKIMKKIDKQMRLNYFLDRRFCTLIENDGKTQDFYSKDLKILGRDLSNVLLVDDKEYSFYFNRPNGILVPIFTGDPLDSCLPVLKDYLDYCYTLKDMRDRKSFENYKKNCKY